MTPEQQKKQNVWFGGVYLALGLVAWGLAGYFVVVPRAVKPAPAISIKTDIPSCLGALTELGYAASDKSDVIVAYEPISTTPKEQLEKASIAATICHHPMVNFCMGEGCEKPGLTLQISKMSEPAPDVEHAKSGSATDSDKKGAKGAAVAPSPVASAPVAAVKGVKP